MAKARPFLSALHVREMISKESTAYFSIDSYALYTENCIIIGCKASYILIRCTWESNKMCLVFMLKINGLTSSQYTKKTSNRAIEEFGLTTERVVVLWPTCNYNQCIFLILLQ